MRKHPQFGLGSTTFLKFFVSSCGCYSRVLCLVEEAPVQTQHRWIHTGTYWYYPYCFNMYIFFVDLAQVFSVASIGIFWLSLQASVEYLFCRSALSLTVRWVDRDLGHVKYWNRKKIKTFLSFEGLCALPGELEAYLWFWMSLGVPVPGKVLFHL